MSSSIPPGREQTFRVDEAVHRGIELLKTGKRAEAEKFFMAGATAAAAQPSAGGGS